MNSIHLAPSAERLNILCSNLELDICFKGVHVFALLFSSYISIFCFDESLVCIHLAPSAERFIILSSLINMDTWFLGVHVSALLLSIYIHSNLPTH